MIDIVESRLYDPSMGWHEAKKLVNELEKESGGGNVDDLLIKFFEGENKKNIRRYRNKTLLDSVLLCFVWHRIHRGLLWDLTTEIFSPIPSKLEKVAAIVKRVSSHLPSNSPLLRFSQFLIFCLRGEYQRAVDVASINIPEGCYLEYYIAGLTSFQMPAYDPGYNKSYRLTNFHNSVEETGALLLLSCDEAYYDKFHEGFINSARRNGVNNIVLFLVVSDREDIYYDKEGRYYKISVVMDFEYSPALYASARFLFVRDVIKSFNESVFIFDIDFDFDKVSLDFLSEVVGSDMGLSFNKYGRSYVPWSNISAAVCYFSGSMVADVFLKAFCFYFERAYEKGGWWIDQNALFYAYNVSRSLFPSGSFHNMIDVRDQGVTNHLVSVVNFKKSKSAR